MVQDFASEGKSALEPGLEVAVVGFPFPHSRDVPFPIWKRAMIAHEPAFLFQGIAQTMLDMPGRPGMSGAPVYALSSARLFTAEQKAAFDKDPLSLLTSINTEQMKTVGLEFLGIYAGSTEKSDLEALNLGRMFGIGFVKALVENGEPGANECPPHPSDFE